MTPKRAGKVNTTQPPLQENCGAKSWLTSWAVARTRGQQLGDDIRHRLQRQIDDPFSCGCKWELTSASLLCAETVRTGMLHMRMAIHGH
ncbi:hypothetical protein ACNKHV_25170 [Shigella flexneri]